MKKYNIKKRLDSVCIIGLGPSALRYIGTLFRNKGKRFTDEVWTINHGGYFLRDYDLIIAMDDMRWKQNEKGYEGYIDNLVRQDKPILTSIKYPEYSKAIAYPKECIGKYGFATSINWPVMNNSVVYSLALAMHRGVKEIWLFGCDFISRPHITKIKDGDPMWRRFHLPENLPKATEPGLDMTMFMLGIAHQKGIVINVPMGTSLFNKDIPPYFYGYMDEDMPDLKQ